MRGAPCALRNMVNRWLTSLTAGRTSALRSLRKRTRVRSDCRPHFSQKRIAIHLLCRRRKNPVEFVMRRHAVILAATLTWLIGIESAEAKLDILVDKATQRMLVIQDGYIRYMWPVSTGRDELATPNGVYAPQRMERNWFSNEYYNSPMPYSIFFYNGYAIHGSYAIDKLGGPASHGCVRLHPHHAALLFDLVQQEGPQNTTIEVTDEPRPEEPPIPAREIPSSGREIAALPGREIPALPGREIPALPPREIPALSGRQMAAAQTPYPPPPKIIRYREPAEMPVLAAVPRPNRSIVAKNTLPTRPPPPAVRRQLIDARPPPATAPRASSMTVGLADTANNSPRPQGEASDNRAKAKVVAESKAAEGKAAEGSPAEPAQTARSAYGFKLLPTSCWNGGASRWRWWSSGQSASCK
jgi:hypothetical protein